MTDVRQQRPIQVGEPAPEFNLPRGDGEGSVSLADFRGRPVLLALDRGLYCPFCRRHLVQLGGLAEKLRQRGVETLAVVAAPAEQARLYLKLRPTRVAVASDPERTVHRAYGLPNPPVTPELAQGFREVRVNPTGELPAPVPILEVNEAVNRLDRWELSEADRAALHSHLHQAVVLVGQFLIDPSGIVRWRNVECEAEGLPGAAKFPSDEEFLAAAAAL